MVWNRAAQQNWKSQPLTTEGETARKFCGFIRACLSFGSVGSFLRSRVLSVSTHDQQPRSRNAETPIKMAASDGVVLSARIGGNYRGIYYWPPRRGRFVSAGPTPSSGIFMADGRHSTDASRNTHTHTARARGRLSRFGGTDTNSSTWFQFPFKRNDNETATETRTWPRQPQSAILLQKLQNTRKPKGLITTGKSRPGICCGYPQKHYVTVTGIHNLVATVDFIR